ncbi:hypothetical protein Tco_0251620 [Tanacetum coccineum]
MEDRNNELSQMNNEQSLRIKELEDILAKKDSTLVYAERINVERAQEKEKLVTQLRNTEMEKFYCVRKLLPVVADKKMIVEYDKLFEKRYPYVEKISHGFRYSVSDLLKVYPDLPPRGQAPPNQSFASATPSTSAPQGS